MLTTIDSVVLLQQLDHSPTGKSWREFSSRYQPVLMAFACKAGLSHADAQDVVQETLMAFVAEFRAGRYDPERGRPRAWLRGIAMNRVRRFRQRPSRREHQVVDDSEVTGYLQQIQDDQLEVAFEEECQKGMLAECLRQAQRVVDPKTYEAFDLYALRGMSPEQVAKQLGISRNAVYIAKSRVLAHARSIREQLAEIW